MEVIYVGWQCDGGLKDFYQCQAVVWKGVLAIYAVTFRRPPYSHSLLCCHNIMQDLYKYHNKTKEYIQILP